LYADDTVLIAENENDLQLLLDILNAWCKHKALNVNFEKTKIVHFRNRMKNLGCPRWLHHSLLLTRPGYHKDLCMHQRGNLRVLCSLQSVNSMLWVLVNILLMTPLMGIWVGNLRLLSIGVVFLDTGLDVMLCLRIF
jgi:hypothetical protein